MPNASTNSSWRLLWPASGAKNRPTCRMIGSLAAGAWARTGGCSTGVSNAHNRRTHAAVNAELATTRR